MSEVFESLIVCSRPTSRKHQLALIFVSLITLEQTDQENSSQIEFDLVAIHRLVINWSMSKRSSVDLINQVLMGHIENLKQDR